MHDTYFEQILGTTNDGFKKTKNMSNSTIHFTNVYRIIKLDIDKYFVLYKYTCGSPHIKTRCVPSRNPADHGIY